MKQEHIDRLETYLSWIHNTVYHEPDTPNFHNQIIDRVINEIILPLGLPRESRILDMGCGSGYFMVKMNELGYGNIVGVTMDDDDIKECRAKGLDVIKQDMTFSDFPTGEFDLLFCRHAIEHSAFPLLTLCEFNRITKAGGTVYIEVPSPNQDRKHEDNQNHFSIMGDKMWSSLFKRVHFKIDVANAFTFSLQDEIADNIFVDQTETFLIYKLTKESNIIDHK
jgi:SAM-dependent methyltransferase